MATTQYPVNNDNDVSLLKKIVNNTALLADTEAGDVSSITGTANRITASQPTGAVVLDISAAYVGQTSITTLGTIGTGVWNATAIADGKIASALTGKTYNGLTLTATTGTFTLAALKVLTVSNTLTLTATDGSTLAIGGGGTLGSAAYTASTAYVPAYSGLTTNGLLQATGATSVTSTLTPSGLTSIGVNSVTSATGAALVLGTGTTGTALSFASATNNASFSSPMDVTKSVAGAALAGLTVSNTSNTASSTASVNTTIAGSTAAGAGFTISVTGIQNYNIAAIGSGNFRMAFGSAVPGSGTAFFLLDAVSSGDIQITPAGGKTNITSGNLLVNAGSVQTSAPNGGTAAAWKLGTVVTGVTTTFVTTSYIQLDVAGTLYKVAIVTSVP